MKQHKQVVSLDTLDGGLDVISYYESEEGVYGADIFLKNDLYDSIELGTTEPMREHLLTLGYNVMNSIEEYS